MCFFSNENNIFTLLFLTNQNKGVSVKITLYSELKIGLTRQRLYVTRVLLVLTYTTNSHLNNH